jgi:hypothetical protein
LATRVSPKLVSESAPIAMRPFFLTATMVVIAYSSDGHRRSQRMR